MNNLGWTAGVTDSAFAGSVAASLIETQCITGKKGWSDCFCIGTPGEQPGG